MSKYYVERQVGESVDDIKAEIQSNGKPGQFVILETGGKRCLKVFTHTGPGLTEQSYGEQLDINNLLEPAIRRGLLRHGTTFEGEYDDIPFGDFQEAQFLVAKGKSMFEALPAAIRKKFEGDPGKFMEFVQDPKNEPWLREQGVVRGLDGLDKDGNPTGFDPSKNQAAEDAANAAREAEKSKQQQQPATPATQASETPQKP